MRNYLFVILIFLSSCDDTLFNSGDTITQEIEISDFNTIYIKDIFDVYFIQDTVCKISVTGGCNLIPNLEFKVDSDKKLNIDNLNKARWSREYDHIQIYISVDTLLELHLNAPANILCTDTLKTPELKIYSITEYSDMEIKVNCGNFYVVNSGTTGGVIKLSGTTNTFGFWARASFRIQAEDFIANTVTAKTESIGDCQVHANKVLSAEILNSGNIYYKGNPDSIIYLNEKAKRQLIKLD